MSMPQPQQQQQPLMTRKKVTIKDPKTLRDVTNDILQPGSQSDTSSVPSQSPATTSMVSWLPNCTLDNKFTWY